MHSQHAARSFGMLVGAKPIEGGLTNADVKPTDAPRSVNSLVIIDPRTMYRQCFAQGFISYGIGMDVLHFCSIDDWRLEGAELPTVVLFKVEEHNISGPSLQEAITKACAEFSPAPVILLSDAEDLSQVLIALDCGAKGYIPTSLNVGVCIQAISLVARGGIFVPASSVLGMSRVLHSEGGPVRPFSGMFTDRQAKVADALRQGKANKIIAYELKLRESTVKVHIRNIMRKLKATNRTEVAFKLSNL